MKRFIQHEPLFIRHFKTSKWPFPLHDHNHFELVFIHSGIGDHVLNNVRKPYQGPCLFLLAPTDYHIFDIKEETEFSVLKFSNGYLSGFSVSQADQSWNKLIDHLLSLHSGRETALKLTKDAVFKIEQLIRLIVGEWEAAENSLGEIILYLIRAVFAYIKQAVISEQFPVQLVNSDLILSVADYIHAHIGEPKALQLNVIAAQFHYSANHLNHLFKEQMRVPIREYTVKHKTKLIENRLKYSSHTIKALSKEFGFSDLSHFNKFLKMQTGLSPKALRQTFIYISGQIG